MNWNQAVKEITPYIVKITTPEGHGTGFFYRYGPNKKACIIATAHHVLGNINESKQPIELYHQSSGQMITCHWDDMYTFAPSGDAAGIAIRSGLLQFPDKPLQLLQNDIALDIGTGVGWLGYPWIADGVLCFFSGSVSARLSNGNSYLIDGVAINGVSGGPVFCANDDRGVQIIGVVSQYLCNQIDDDLLPGLLLAQDVSHFHDIDSFLNFFSKPFRRKKALPKA